MDSTFYIQWHTTNNCNLRCLHCYQDDFSREGDLGIPGLKGIAENFLATLEAWERRACVHLTGGEPLLNPGLFSLLDHLNGQSGVEELGIITNGMLLHRELIKRISGIEKLKYLKISLDGGDAATNDAIRRVGSFQRVLRNVPLVREMGKFEVVLMFTAMKRNYRSLPALIRLAQDLEIQGLIIERFIPWGQGKLVREEVLERDQWRELIQTLFEFFAIDQGGEIPPYQAFQISFSGGEPELMGAPCVVGDDGCCIMPDGSLFPCRRFPLPLGNLLRNSLKNIWEESTLLRQLRDKRNLKGKCRLCGQEGCTGCRSLAYALTGDFFGEDPHCPLTLDHQHASDFHRV